MIILVLKSIFLKYFRGEYDSNDIYIWTDDDENCYKRFKYNHKFETKKCEHYLISLFLNSKEFLDLHEKEVNDFREKMEEKKRKEKLKKEADKKYLNVNIDVIKKGYNIELEEISKKVFESIIIYF